MRHPGGGPGWSGKLRWNQRGFGGDTGGTDSTEQALSPGLMLSLGLRSQSFGERRQDLSVLLWVPVQDVVHAVRGLVYTHAQRQHQREELRG